MAEEHSLAFDDLRRMFVMRPQENGEGTLITQNLDDGHSTAILALSGGTHFSALHRLHATEVYHFYGGASREFLLLHPDGQVTTPSLGADYAAGQRPQLVVAAGVWQGSRSSGEWSLTGATMAPGFRSDRFEMGDPAELSRQFPEHASRIRELSHES